MTLQHWLAAVECGLLTRTQMYVSTKWMQGKTESEGSHSLGPWEAIPNVGFGWETPGYRLIRPGDLENILVQSETELPSPNPSKLMDD